MPRSPCRLEKISIGNGAMYALVKKPGRTGPDSLLDDIVLPILRALAAHGDERAQKLANKIQSTRYDKIYGNLDAWWW